MRRSFALALFLLVLAAPGRAADAPSSVSSAEASVPIAHFREVRPGVYRGAQPDEKGWLYLKALGVKTIVKLDLPSEGSDDEAARLGMKVVDASGPPATFRNFLGAPKPEQIEKALKTLQDQSQWPVYVHCRHGQDRTGLVIGLFRVLHDGYTKAAAYQEMRANGFHRGLLGLTHVWDRFDGRRAPGTEAAR